MPGAFCDHGKQGLGSCLPLTGESGLPFVRPWNRGKTCQNRGRALCCTCLPGPGPPSPSGDVHLLASPSPARLWPRGPPRCCSHGTDGLPPRASALTAPAREAAPWTLARPPPSSRGRLVPSTCSAAAPSQPASWSLFPVVFPSSAPYLRHPAQFSEFVF